MDYSHTQNHVYHFMKNKSDILRDFPPNTKTLNAGAYGSIMKKLRRVFQNQRQGLHSDMVSFPYAAAVFHVTLVWLEISPRPSTGETSITSNIFNIRFIHVSVFHHTIFFLWRILQSSRMRYRIDRLASSARCGNYSIPELTYLIILIIIFHVNQYETWIK